MNFYRVFQFRILTSNGRTTAGGGGFLKGSPSFEVTKDLLVFVKVERVIVELNQTRRTNRFQSFYKLKERTEGSICFVVPGKFPNAISDCKSKIEGIVVNIIIFFIFICRKILSVVY